MTRRNRNQNEKDRDKTNNKTFISVMKQMIKTQCFIKNGYWKLVAENNYNQIEKSIVLEMSLSSTEHYSSTAQKEKCIFRFEILFRLGLTEFRSFILCNPETKHYNFISSFFFQNKSVVDSNRKLHNN